MCNASGCLLHVLFNLTFFHKMDLETYMEANFHFSSTFCVFSSSLSSNDKKSLDRLVLPGATHSTYVSGGRGLMDRYRD